MYKRAPSLPPSLSSPPNPPSLSRSLSLSLSLLHRQRYVQAHATSAHVRQVAQAHAPPWLRFSLLSRLLPFWLSVPAASAGDRLLSVDGAGAGDRLEGLSTGPASAWLALGSRDREAAAAAMMGGESLGVARSPKWTLTLRLPAPSTVNSAETAAIATTCKRSSPRPRTFAPPACAATAAPPPPSPPLGGGASPVILVWPVVVPCQGSVRGGGWRRETRNG